MKKLFLFIATIASLNAKSQTSVYHPFPDSSAIWNFECGLFCFMGSTVENYSIVISGDTTINSVTYHKLTTPYIQAVMLGTCTANYAGYKGAFRNDVANKKVFYVPPSNSIEQLLYDFTMQVGDTVKGFLETFTFPSDIVNSIDSVLVGSNYRKRWNIDPCYYVSIIEGIGSTYGLVQPSPGCFVDQANYWLTCFSQNNFTLYPDTTANCLKLKCTMHLDC
jgi:hypothetical protein